MAGLFLFSLLFSRWTAVLYDLLDNIMYECIYVCGYAIIIPLIFLPVLCPLSAPW